MLRRTRTWNAVVKSCRLFWKLLRYPLEIDLDIIYVRVNSDKDALKKNGNFVLGWYQFETGMVKFWMVMDKNSEDGRM